MKAMPIITRPATAFRTLGALDCACRGVRLDVGNRSISQTSTAINRSFTGRLLGMLLMWKSQYTKGMPPHPLQPIKGE